MRMAAVVVLVAAAGALFLLVGQHIAGTSPSDRARDAGWVKAGP